MTTNPSGFFAGTVTPPEVNSTDALVNELTSQVATVTAANSAAQAAATVAQAAASNAGISEANVATLAQQATTSLTAANASIADAQAAVTGATTTLAAAEASASAAATSATTAGNDATAASGSATAAASSASAASASQTAAASSASTATTQASSASVSAGTATTQATNAASSASAASTSASSAATAQSAASTSASNAATSAGSASSSATAAANSAGNSLTYSTNASGSAGAAASSAAAAAASAASITLPLPVSSGGLGTTSIQGAVTALGIVGKNRIINGMGLAIQRGNTAFAVNASGYGGPDRFACNNSGTGAAITQSQGQITANGTTYPSVTQTVVTAGTSYTGTNYLTGICQSIEGANCFDLMGQEVTLSFLFQASVAGLYSAALRGYATSSSNLTQFNYTTAGAPQRVVITLPGVPTSMAIPGTSAGGLVLHIAACTQGTYCSPSGFSGVWQTGEFFGSPSDTMWGSTVGHYISATMIQLEAGPVATEFEWIDYGRLLRQCQRYYWLWGASSVNIAGMHTNTTTGYSFGLRYPVTMRATPSGLLVGSWLWTNATGGGGTAGVDPQTPDLFYLSAASTATAPSAFSSGYFSTGAGANAQFTAEL